MATQVKHAPRTTRVTGAAPAFSLKDQLFNRDKVRFLAGCFAPHVAGFDPDAFEAEVMSKLPDLELKERITWIAQCLSRHIPGTLSEVAAPLRLALPPPLDPSLSDDDFGDFIFAPLGEWVVMLCAAEAEAGPEERALGLDLLEEITQRFSMEWAIRPFLQRWPEAVLARMQDWALHENYHVRRLASEGSRPRLPWGMAVPLSLEAPLAILDQLHGDPTRYVTRSVANHLNDITKKAPDLVLERLQTWQAEERQEAGELAWMTAHALRGLVKAGDPAAMRLLGFDPDLALEVTLALPQTVRIGEAMPVGAELSGPAGQKVLVDYAITFLRPSGRPSRKVFKLKQAKLRAGPLELGKKHPLKGNATTFQLVPGPHRLELMVNGIVRAEAEFELLA